MDVGGGGRQGTSRNRQIVSIIENTDTARGIAFELLDRDGAFCVWIEMDLPGCEGFALGEIVLENFIACWDGLEDPRRGNAGLHDFHEILAIALVWGLRCQPSICSSFPVSSELQFAAARLSPPTSYPVGFAIPNHDPGIREREFGAAPHCETAPLSRSRAIDGGHRSRARSEAAMKVVLMLSSSLPPE